MEFCYSYFTWVFTQLNARVTQLFVEQLFQVKKKENINATHHWPFVKGIPLWPVDYPLQKAVIQKAFPCQAVVLAGESGSATDNW